MWIFDKGTKFVLVCLSWLFKLWLKEIEASLWRHILDSSEDHLKHVMWCVQNMKISQVSCPKGLDFLCTILPVWILYVVVSSITYTLFSSFRIYLARINSSGWFESCAWTRWLRIIKMETGLVCYWFRLCFK